MPREEPTGFDYTVGIAAPPARILGAFFDPRALGVWWGVSRAIANPTVLGAYALEWPRSETVDALLGPLGGTLHGTVIDYKAGRAFFVAEAYWVPPRNAPVGPMSLEVTCTTRGPFQGAVDAIAARLPGRTAVTRQTDKDTSPDITSLRLVQRGYEESERWRRYYALLGASLPVALEKLKEYLEHGRGAWDLREW
jgi:uncharacterized protein YndB with AHSA1/START domain